MIAQIQNHTTGSWEIPFHTCQVIFLGATAYKRASALLQSLFKAALARITYILSPFLFFSHYLLAFFSSPLSYRIPWVIDLKSVFILHACIFHLSASIFKLKYVWHPTKQVQHGSNAVKEHKVMICNYDTHGKTWVPMIYLFLCREKIQVFFFLFLPFHQ